MSNLNDIKTSQPQLIPRSNSYDSSLLTYLSKFEKQVQESMISIMVDGKIKIIPQDKTDSIQKISSKNIISWACLVSSADFNLKERTITYHLDQELERISLVHFLENSEATIELPPQLYDDFVKNLQHRIEEYKKQYTITNGLKSTFRALVLTILEIPLPVGGPLPTLLPVFFASLLIPYQNYLITKKLKALDLSSLNIEIDQKLEPVQDLLTENQFQEAYTVLDDADDIPQNGFIPKWLPLAETIHQKNRSPELNLMIPDNLVFRVSEWVRTIYMNTGEITKKLSFYFLKFRTS